MRSRRWAERQMIWISRSRGSSPRRAEFRQRDIERARYTFHDQLDRLAHIQKECAVPRIPMTERHVAAKDIRGNHSGEVHRVLGAAKLRGVAKFRLLKVVNGGSHLEVGRQRADPLVHRRSVLAERLGTEEFAVGFAEDHLEADHLRSGVVAGVGVRIDIDLLVVGVAPAIESFLAHSGPRRRAAEEPDDGSPLRAPVARIATADYIGRDAALAVGRARERDQALFACNEILHLDGVADRQNVGVAGAHVIIHEDAATLADFEARRLGQGGVRPHADGENHEVRRESACRSWSGPRWRRRPTA